MAFKKTTNFAFEQNLTIASGDVDGKISIPLVITKENGEYHGFVPGIVMNDIVCKDILECQNKLKEFVKNYVLEARKNNSPYPFFPTNEEIKADFGKVVMIKRISAKTKD